MGVHTISRILQYTYWLTFSHIDNFRNVPLIEVSVEDGSTMKHCRKKKKASYIHSQRARKEGGRTLIIILWQPKRRQTFFKSHASLHQHQPPEWTSLNHVTSSSNIRMQQTTINLTRKFRKIMKSHKKISRNLLRLKQHDISYGNLVTGPKAWNLIRKSYNSKTAWNLIRNSHKKLWS
jgi:hypothetical protein